MPSRSGLLGANTRVGTRKPSHARAFDQRLESAAQAGAVAAAGRGRGADVDGTLRRGPSLSRHEQSTGLSFELRKETVEPVNEIGWRRPVRAGSTSCGRTAVWTLLVATLLALMLFERSRTGVAVRATGADPVLANLLGADVMRLRV